MTFFHHPTAADPVTAQCEHCGRAFEARRSTARFCSATCRQRARRAGKPTVETETATSREVEASSRDTWPPPPTVERPWHRRRLLASGGQVAEFRVREVDLWGQPVLVDEAGAVWCDGCWHFVQVAEPGRLGNSHPVGLPARTDGVLLPMADDEAEPSARPLARGSSPAWARGF